MTRAVLMALGLAMASSFAAAGERAYGPRPPSPAGIVTRPSMYPGLSGSVLASDACRRGCEAQCGGRFVACLRLEHINHCRDETDACDRACVRQCRAYGGPVLNITDWPFRD